MHKTRPAAILFALLRLGGGWGLFPVSAKNIFLNEIKSNVYVGIIHTRRRFLNPCHCILKSA